VCSSQRGGLVLKLAANALTWQISLAFGSVAFFLVEPTVPGEPVNCQHVIGNQAKQFGDKSARNYSISSSTTGAQMSLNVIKYSFLQHVVIWLTCGGMPPASA